MNDRFFLLTANDKHLRRSQPRRQSVREVSGRLPPGQAPGQARSVVSLVHENFARFESMRARGPLAVRKHMPKGNPCGRAYFCELKLARA